MVLKAKIDGKISSNLHRIHINYKIKVEDPNPCIIFIY